MMNGSKETADDGFQQVDFGLEQAQKTLKEVLNSLQLDGLAELPSAMRDVTSQADVTGEIIDFESIFEQNGLLDVNRKDKSSAHVAVSPPFHSATYPPPVLPHRPDRPLTLSRPGQLPSCCNFKRQHWRLYVQGEFSYSSLPRHFKDAEKELNTSYKDDLENIIRDLSEKEKILESEQVLPAKNDSQLKSLTRNRSSNSATPEVTTLTSTSASLLKGTDVVKSSGDSNAGLSADKNGCDPGFDDGVGCTASCSQISDRPGKDSVVVRAKCLMEDINKNCENIKSQLAILENVSQMIDRAHPKLSLETETNHSAILEQKSSSPSQKIESGSKPEATSPRKTFSRNFIQEYFKTTDKTSATPLDSLLPSDHSSASVSPSPCKKLKSRKSRNRSLQRCSDDRLSASERRSRTLSPSITERLDYKVSRSTQTSDVPVTFDPMSRENSAEMQKVIPVIPSPGGRENGKCSILIQPFIRQSSGRDSKKNKQPLGQFPLCRKTSDDTAGKKANSETPKASPLLSHSRKLSQKLAASFLGSSKSEAEKPDLSAHDQLSQEKSTTTDLNSTLEAEQSEIKRSETLLDKMHKKLYPYQYNKLNRTRSSKVSSLVMKKSSMESDMLTHLTTTSQPNSASPSASPKPPLGRRHTDNERSFQTESSKIMNSIDAFVNGVSKAAPGKDSCTGDVASPSSGYSEMSPVSVKENAASPTPSRRLCFARVASPEQSTTSSSTPSPPNGAVSVVKVFNEVQSAGKNCKDLGEVQAAEKKLTEVCEWLISAGFPQYVQLYREGHFPVALTTVESDHEFLDQDCRLLLLQRIILLNKLTSMKIRLPLTSAPRDWYSSEMLFAVSPIWSYDPSYHWWLRTDRAFIGPNWATSGSLPRDGVASEHSRSEEVLKEGLGTGGCITTPLEVHDEASVHLTSGYESETSPISSSSLGRQKPYKDAPHSSSQSTPNQSRAAASWQTSVLLKVNSTEDNQGRETAIVSCSSEETLRHNSSTSCGSSVSNQQGILLNHLTENIPGRCGENASVDLDRTKLKENNQERRASRKVSSSSAVVSAALGQQQTSKTNSLCGGSKAETNKIRASTYDNAAALPGDPQAQLDLILKELYRNIGCLDETLSSLVERDECRSFEDALKLLGDEECSNDVFPETDNVGADVQEVPMSTVDIPHTAPVDRPDPAPSDRPHTVPDVEDSRFTEDVRYCQLYPSKKAFLSLEDLVRLRKLCILKLTSVFETQCSPSKMDFVCPLRYQMSAAAAALEQEDYEGRIFGVPLAVLLRRLTVPLPPTITIAMEHLKSVACDSIGIFRKPGVQSRIQQLQNEMENNPGFEKFDAIDAYDLADVLKRYFRELPESLLTPYASRLLLTIFTDLPQELYLETVQAVMLLLSDANRQVLHVLLRFLAAVAERCKENQMTSSNLAVCFLPSFFQPQCLSSSTSHAIEARTNSQSQTTDVADGTNSVWDHKVAVLCISFLIDNAGYIFQIPDFGWTMLTASSSIPDTLSSSAGVVGDFRSVDISSFVQNAFDICSAKDSDWMPLKSRYEQTEVSCRAVDDNHLLPMWRCSTAIEAPPGEVLARLKNELHLWESSFVKGRVVDRLSDKTDVFHYMLYFDNHDAPREFCELRTWKNDREKGSFVMAKTSVFHPNVPLTDTLRAITFVSHYLIEPCGAGKSRVTHVSRVDIRGHLLDWYHNVYGRLLERHIHKLYKAFASVTLNAVGPETNL